MGKLQKIKRKNGSIIHLAYLPNAEVERAGLKKGDELSVKCIAPRTLMVKKNG